VLRRLKTASWLSGLLLTGFGCGDDSSAPTAQQSVETTPNLEIGGASDSGFRPERLPLGDEIHCVGFADPDADGQLEIVAVSSLSIWVVDGPAADAAIIQTELPDVVSFSCTTGDVDGDGALDVVLAGPDGGAVWRGLGDNHFVAGAQLPRIVDQATTSPPLTESAALLDFDADGDLDLYVGANLAGAPLAFLMDGCDSFPTGEGWCGDPLREYEGLPNVALENDGAGAFTRLPSSGAEWPGQTLSVAAVDVDDDGLQDLLVANDGGSNRLFLSAGDGTFRDQTSDYELTRYNHGMGIAHGDLNNDRQPDLVFSDVGSQLVYLSEGDRYVVAGPDRGLLPVMQWGWGVELEDLDNDGDLDMLFANELLPEDRFAFLNASVAACSGCTFPWPEARVVLLYRNAGAARFSAEYPFSSDATIGNLEDDLGATALSTGDFDRDGVLDALLIRREHGTTFDSRGSVWLLRGWRSGDGAAVEIAVPLGARVEVCAAGRCQRRELGSGGSYLSIRPHRLHFGIGSADEADVVVEWPRGEFHDLGSVAAGTVVRFPED